MMRWLPLWSLLSARILLQAVQHANAFLYNPITRRHHGLPTSNHKSSLLQATTPSDTTGAGESTQQSVPDQPPPMIKTDYVVVGGGPAGLLSCIMLAQKFPGKEIKMLDRLPPPPSPTDKTVWSQIAKFYLIGIGSRGQRALDQFGLLGQVKKHCVRLVGRKDWAPGATEGVERIFEERYITTHCLPRDKLVAILHQYIVKNYADQIELNYGFEVEPLDFGTDNKDDPVVLKVMRCSPNTIDPNANSQSLEEVRKGLVVVNRKDYVEMSCDLLIAADGAQRTVATTIQEKDEERRMYMGPIERLFAGKPFKVKKYQDDNRRVYKTMPMKLPAGWRTDINYAARTKGSRMVFDALPANDSGDYCGVFLFRAEDPLAQPGCSPDTLRKFLDESLPEFSAIIGDNTLAECAMKPPSLLPTFQYAGPRLNEGHKTVIIGDCAHTLKPYFGMGANSALEDVRILSDYLFSNQRMGEALRKFSEHRAADSMKLVQMSRDLDRPGALGVVTFLLPIILDAIFHKLLPQIFGPNVIAMIQTEKYTFRQVARKKRFDRFMQVALLVGGCMGFTAGIKLTRALVQRTLGPHAATVGAFIAGAITAKLFPSLFSKLVPKTATVDVMNKS